MQVVLAQIGDVTAASEGLSKGGLAFVCAVLGALTWALYRENRDLSKQLLAQVEKHSEVKEKLINDKLELIKEIMPLAHKLTDSVQLNGQIAKQLTRE